MKHVEIVVVLAVAIGTGCGAPGPRQRAAARESIEPERVAGDLAHHDAYHHDAVPLSARVEGPRAPVPGAIPLTIVVERHAPIAIPVVVAPRAPAGATLRDPETAVVTLAPNDASRVDRIEVIVECDGLPQDDFVAVVDARGRGMGLHAEPAYRFGRPAPLPAAPPLDARPIAIGGRSFGRPVQIAVHEQSLGDASGRDVAPRSTVRGSTD